MRNSNGSTKDLTAFNLTLPVAMGYIPLGMVFGFLFVQAGGPAWLAVLASVLIYAGAAQFMMIPMLVAGLPIGAIVLATFVINLRHIFYGLPLLADMPRQAWQKAYCIFALTDESFSVLTALPAARRQSRMLLLCALNHGWWIAGTTLGAVLGAQARLEITGLDFVLASLFAVLAVEQWRSRGNLRPVWVAIAAYGLAASFVPGQALFLAISLSVLALLFGPAAEK